MDVYEAINKRSSVRDFTRENIPDDVIERILDAACRAPTAGNLQPWRFFVIRDLDLKKALSAAAYGQDFVAKAPVVIVVCADLDSSAQGYGSRGENLYAIQDTAAAVENMLLAIVAEGYGACWVGAFNERALSDVLRLPRRIRPLALVPVGKPAYSPRRTGRIPFKKLTVFM